MLPAENATTAQQLVSGSRLRTAQSSRLKHGWTVDNCRADTVHELYVDDGELNVPPTPLRGRQALIEWGRQLVEAPPWRSIRHACGNMRFVAEGHIAARARPC